VWSVNRAELHAAFDREVRQSTASDGTGATVEQDAHVVRTVDAFDQSRPILERMGFECFAITTPYTRGPEQVGRRASG